LPDFRAVLGAVKDDASHRQLRWLLRNPRLRLRATRDGRCLRHEGNRKESIMLRIYEDALVMLESLRAHIATIERHDSDLARQLRRASASVVLNIAEGSYARGRNRKALYSVALGSAKEVRACLDVAKAFRYFAAIDESIAAKLNVICGVLFRLTR
jgi:four helix bundle protein